MKKSIPSNQFRIFHKNLFWRFVFLSLNDRSGANFRTIVSREASQDYQVRQKNGVQQKSSIVLKAIIFHNTDAVNCVILPNQLQLNYDESNWNRNELSENKKLRSFVLKKNVKLAYW